MNKKLATATLTILFLLWPAVSLGANFIVAENSDPAVTTDEINDDLYIFGNSANIDHNIQEDLFAVGNMVNINAQIGQNLHAAGNTVAIEGSVQDDVFAAGSTVSINLEQADDIFTAGSLVDIAIPQIEGGVYAAGQTINLSGNISGNTRISGESINIKSGTVIQGDLLTFGEKEPNIEDNVTIEGSTKHTVPKAKGTRTDRNMILQWLTGVITWFVIAFLFTYLLPATGKDIITTTFAKSGKSLIIGLVWILLFVPAFFLLLFTFVGWPLAIMLGLLTATLLIAAYAYTIVIVGTYTMQKLGKTETDMSWQHLLLGAVLVQTIALLPLIGGLVIMVITFISLGAIGQTLYSRLRKETITIKDASENK